MRKGLDIGVDDFKKLIENDCYYIDKTKFIEDILKDGSEVQLSMRPRRFGKTLNMSTLKYFLGIENKELFKGLYIENSPLISEQGKYPVVFISMKSVKGRDFKDLNSSLKKYFRILYGKYRFLKEKLKEDEIKYFNSVLNEEKEDLRDGLLTLNTFLSEYHNQQVVVLIDEYDAPLLSAYEHGYYDKGVDFFKEFYGAVLKTNVNLKFGVMTGAIRVAQAGYFQT